MFNLVNFGLQGEINKLYKLITYFGIAMLSTGAISLTLYTLRTIDEGTNARSVLQKAKLEGDRMTIGLDIAEEMYESLIDATISGKKLTRESVEPFFAKHKENKEEMKKFRDLQDQAIDALNFFDINLRIKSKFVFVISTFLMIAGGFITRTGMSEWSKAEQKSKKRESKIT